MPRPRSRDSLERVSRKRKALLVASAVALCLVIAAAIGFRISFPGRQASIALRLATGIGISSLQTRIDGLEAKAVAKETFTQEDRAFLTDFYTCLATGARLTVILGQSGRLMQHYLDGSGEPLELGRGIFTGNWKVRKRMERLRGQIRQDARGKGMRKRYSSGTFHMPHPSVPDSVFGLYYGTIEARPERRDGRIVITWRAEVPWQWPSYASLERKYGDPHAESFPLPNPLCVFGLDHALYVDNGLGEHLVQVDLAKPFLAYAEWQEVLESS